MGMFDAVWALLTVGFLAWVYAWASKNRGAHARKNPKFVAMGIAVIAVLWTIFRSVTHVQAVLIRPLEAMSIILFALAAVAVLVLIVVKQSKIATWAAWASLVFAIFMPFDFGSAWSAWLTGSTLSVWMGVGTIVLTALLIWKIGKTKAAAGVTLLFAVIMLIAALQFASTGTAGPSQSTPSPSTEAAPSATPSATVTSTSPSPSATSSASPSATVTQALKELSASEGSMIGWDNVTALVSGQDATWFSQLIDDNHAKLGFNWNNVEAWSKARMSNGDIAGARLVVVFDADKSEITDPAAKKLVGVAGNKAISVVRATGCYTRMADNSEVCPSDDDRVVLFLAPIGKDSGGIGLKTGSGIALVPSSDGKVVLTPSTYVVR